MIKNLRLNKTKLGAISSSLLLSITLTNVPSAFANSNHTEIINDTVSTSIKLSDNNLEYIYNVQNLDPITGELIDERTCIYSFPQEDKDNIKYVLLGKQYSVFEKKDEKLPRGKEFDSEMVITKTPQRDNENIHKSYI